MQISKPKKGYKKIKWNYSKEITIPEKWEILTLGQVSKQIQDADHSVPKETKFGIPFLSVNDIARDEEIDFSKCSFVSEDNYLEFIKKIKPEKNDILYTRVATVGIARLIQKNKKMVISSNAVVIKLKNSIFPAFLKEQLNDNLIKNNLDSHKAGTAYSFLSLSEIRKINLIIPSYDEQQKIASILSNVNNTLEKTNQLIQKMGLLKKGLMQKLLTKGIDHTKFKKIEWLFGKQIEIPEEWEIKKLEEVAEITRGKFGHRPRNDPDYYGGKHPFIQTGDIENSDGFITDYSQTLNDKGLRVSKYFPANTIVITIAANIGGTAITTFPVCFPDSLIGITSKIMNIRFLEYYLRTQKKYLENVAHTSAQKNINYLDLKPLLIPVPSLDEQIEIASILSNVDSQITKEKLQKSNLVLLKKGLMQKLLTGKIRVKF